MRLFLRFRVIPVVLAISIPLCGTGRAQDDSESRYGRKITGDELVLALDLLAAQVRGNLENLETWCGKCRYTDSKYLLKDNPILPENQGTADKWNKITLSEKEIELAAETIKSKNGYWFIKEGTALFQLDNLNGSSRTFNEPSNDDDVWDLSTGLQYRNTQSAFAYYTIWTPDRFVEFSPEHLFVKNPRMADSGDFPSARLAFVAAPGTSKSTSLIDIRECFTTGTVPTKGVSGYYWRRPEMIAASLRGERSIKDQELAKTYTSLFVNGDKIPVYTLVYGNMTEANVVVQFDGGVGLNVVFFSQGNGEKRNSWRRTKYTEKSGHYLPNELRSNTIFYDEKGEVVGAFARTLAIETESINEPIPVTTFDLLSLGMRYGDRKFDETSKEMFVYDDRSGFVPANEFQLDESRLNRTQKGGDERKKIPQRRGSRTLLFVNVILVMGVIAVLVMRKYSRPHK